MGNHKVRLAGIADAAEIAACVSALGYGTSASLVAERLATYATSPADAVFVASVPGNESLLGVVGVHLLPLLHTPGLLGRITSLSVVTEARGNGVGKALVAAAEEWAWSEGAWGMEVTSGDHRPVAHAFYQAIGYALDNRRFMKLAAKASQGRKGRATSKPLAMRLGVADTHGCGPRRGSRNGETK